MTFGPLVTSPGRIEHTILCALRAGTLPCRGTLHILLCACVISVHPSMMALSHPYSNSNGNNDSWELLGASPTCQTRPSASGALPRLSPHPFPPRCLHLTDETDGYLALQSVL